MATHGERTTPNSNSILEPGRNCWRTARADRLSVLVDAAAYFDAFAAAVQRARHSILVVGWDIHSLTRLWRDDVERSLPAELGEFLNTVVARRRGLHAYVLDWDFAMIFALEREALPVFKLGWRTHRRLRFELDANHPLGGSQHQKIVVVDDRIAFAGGLDLTIRRWDTSEHAPDDARRRDPHGEPYGPFHDVQVAVDGEAAVALGALVRERWHRATGRRLPPRRTRQGSDGDPWPDGLEADMTDVCVGIARTEPAFEDRPEVKEVEHLYVDAIRSARRRIYIENQYLTSDRIAEVLSESLRSADGPEIVIVLPSECSGWLEESTVGFLRNGVLQRLHAADRHGRLGIYFPSTGEGPSGLVHVHSKVLVVDDALLRIGSANLSNRSMGLDSECDLVVEARADSGHSATIASIRSRLVGEHLGVPAEQVDAASEERGSLLAAVEHLRGGERTLQPIDIPDEQEQLPESVVSVVRLADPESPIAPERLAHVLLPEDVPSSVWQGPLRIVLLLLPVLAMAAAWRWTPLHEWLQPETLRSLAEPLRTHVAGIPIVVAGYVVAGFVVFPVVVLIVATLLLFGPWWGIPVTLIGCLASAAATYAAGAVLGRSLVRRIAGPGINRVSRRLGERGILTIVALRIIPVAPYTIVNLVAGASHIRFRDYFIGTLFGMTPGICSLALVGEGLVRALRTPSAATVGVLVGFVVLLVVAARYVRARFADGREHESDDHSAHS